MRLDRVKVQVLLGEHLELLLGDAAGFRSVAAGNNLGSRIWKLRGPPAFASNARQALTKSLGLLGRSAYLPDLKPARIV